MKSNVLDARPDAKHFTIHFSWNPSQLHLFLRTEFVLETFMSALKF